MRDHPSEAAPRAGERAGGEDEASNRTPEPLLVSEREAARLWGVDDVAEYCGVSERTVRSWLQHRGLPAIRIGRVLRFEPASVRAWLAERERREGGGA